VFQVLTVLLAAAFSLSLLGTCYALTRHAFATDPERIFILAFLLVVGRRLTQPTVFSRASGDKVGFTPLSREPLLVNNLALDRGRRDDFAKHPPIRWY
jgi:cytochrome c biogenesis factor